MSNPSQDTTAFALSSVVAALEGSLDASTNATLSELSQLHATNQSLTKHYEAMANAAEGLGDDAEYLRSKYDEIHKYAGKVDEIESRVSNLEEIVRELDDWTIELENKMKRLSKAKRTR